MSTFFSVAEKLYHEGLLEGFEDHYNNVIEVQQYLFNRQIKMNLDVMNMENIFSAIDMGITLGGIGALTAPKLQVAKDSFIRLTCKVLDVSQTIIKRIQILLA